MNNQTQEALKMAIETLESDQRDFMHKDWNGLINAFKEALEQPAQEPLGWIPATYKYNLVNNDDEYPIGMVYHSKRDENDVAVYTQPVLAQEPVLYIDQSGLDGHATWAQPNACQDTDIPLYTHPHQWQGLTDDEIEILIHETNLLDDHPYEFVRAYESKLKEKNHGN